MKRSWRKLLWIALGGLASVIVAALVALPFLIDVDRHRGLIEQRARAALGREVRLGELHLSLFPLGVRIDDLGLGALPGESGGDLLTARRVRVGARLLPLLRKQLEVTSIEVVEPRLRLERGADGQWNLARLVSGQPTGAAAGGSRSFVVQQLSVTGGSVTVVAAPLEVTLTGLDLRVADLSRERPFELKLSADLEGGGRLSVQGRLGPIAGGTLPAELSVHLDPIPLPLVRLVLGEQLELTAGDVSLAANISGTLPDHVELRGSAQLHEITFRHPSMKQPIEHVEATMTLDGQRVEIRDLRGVIGSSDVAGRVTLDGFTDPRVHLDLASKRADFGELFSFLAPQQQSSAAGGSAGDALDRLKLDGSLRIESGSFRTLDFSGLEAGLSWADGVLRLDPVKAQLYGGSFAGRIESRLGESRPRFAVRGEAQRIDVGAFLADNLASGELLTGRFSGKLETQGSGLDYAAIVRSLEGSGSMEVGDGKVGQLDVLQTLSRVSGIFGETTLKELSGQMASAGTAFDKLSSGLQLAGGRMSFDELQLESPAFKLLGHGGLDLLSSKLEGRFELILSHDVSAKMRAEKSRAADLFYNSRTQQVELPFSLSGPFDSPTPSVDFQAVAREALRERSGEKLRDILGQKLGLDRRPPPSATTPAPPPPTGTLAAEVTTARWTGPLLARDLRLEGLVRGAGIQAASLSLTDARGREIRRIERIEEIERHVAAAGAAAGPAVVPWSLKVDGSKLVLANYPLTVKVVVTGQDGGQAEAVRVVER